MAVKVKNQPGADDITGVKINLWVPFVITVACASLDMLSQYRSVLSGELTIDHMVYWFMETLISYFFPSFFSMIVALIAQSLLMKNWSGFRENKKGCVFAVTCIYLFGYIVYLMYRGTCYEYVFFVMNLIYVCYCITRT